ncbi:ribosomal lysine N-methyltransferase 3 [Syzygium oleosum]|uniref:ribosomal lysine N-methyltransferase 3 n=1 Tax=Syzygium oleosum TaxID=219896 RepID=UPI0011D2A8CF|nr:ribosomal lysine N-methyltransferase 3 [Syzygium oleosum]
MASRRLRAFKRWMKSQSIDSGDALRFTDDPSLGIAVRALRDLREGDVVAAIPKAACLTVRTGGASSLVEAAGLEGSLGLSVALMYERSLGASSPWAGYLQLLPEEECLPMVWTLDEVDGLLRGTELHKTVREDKALIYDDWKESILPLLDSGPLKLKPEFFGPEQYFAARSLVASRSFEIDEYHGSGMVPLADLFNHKTGAEDVHFTNVSSHGESDDDSDYGDDYPDADITEDGNGQLIQDLDTNSHGNMDMECPPVSKEDPAVLEMILLKDVKAGDEVYNTYGTLGNAALLHRYGFTEENNPYDIVNIDIELVLEWSNSLFSNRHSRARVAMWRKLNYSGCVSQDSEYFEISYKGEPQLELMILLYMMLLPDDAYNILDLAVSTEQDYNLDMLLSEKDELREAPTSELSKDLLVTEGVCKALLELANIREGLYGPNSIRDDIEALNMCRCSEDRKLYYTLILRVCERKILEKLRRYASFKVEAFGRKKGFTRRDIRK